LVDISALALMILDPLYQSMSIANAAAVTVRPQLWSRHRAMPRLENGHKNPSRQSALPTDLGEKKQPPANRFSPSQIKIL
jgi:hypothetical protein